MERWTTKCQRLLFCTLQVLEHTNSGPPVIISRRLQVLGETVDCKSYIWAGALCDPKKASDDTRIRLRCRFIRASRRSEVFGGTGCWRFDLLDFDIVRVDKV